MSHLRRRRVRPFIKLIDYVYNVLHCEHDCDHRMCIELAAIERQNDARPEGAEGACASPPQGLLFYYSARLFVPRAP
jgi:hypothetical protein